MTVKKRPLPLPLPFALLIFFALIFVSHLALFSVKAFAEELNLQSLIDEALKNNHEILMREARAAASKFRIRQAETLPDPMLMFGYQNEGFRRYTFSESPDAQWMFSVSQMFPFPGKLSLKAEMAGRDSEAIEASTQATKLMTVEKVKELYYDLFLAHKNIELIHERTALFSRVEEAALTRYSTGMGTQQEVLMAQTEKYMLFEKEEMFRQKVKSLEVMLISVIGIDIKTPLGKPPKELTPSEFSSDLNDLLTSHIEHSPILKEKGRMVASAEARVKMAEKEYYPDMTLNASYFLRNKEVPDMWSMSATFNIPIFYKTKQRQTVLEAKALLSEARHDYEGTRLMLISKIRDNYYMLKSSEKLMELYRNGLMPKAYQDYELAIAGYITGKVEAVTVISRLKTFIDYENQYWTQFIEREKAIARLETITGHIVRKSAVTRATEK